MDIADHEAVFVVEKTWFETPHLKQSTKFRDVSAEKISAFTAGLVSSDFTDILEETEDIGLAYDKFFDIITSVGNETLPIKEV